MDRCGLQSCTPGTWALFMHFRLPLYDKPFLKYRMSKANLLIFSNIFHFTFWPITFFPYNCAVGGVVQRRTLTASTTCTRPLSGTMSGNLFFGASKQKVPKKRRFWGLKTAPVFFVVGSGWRNFARWRRVPSYGAWPKRQSRKICPFGARSKNMQKTSILRGFCPPGKSWLRHCAGNVHYWATLDEIYQAKKTGSS